MTLTLEQAKSLKHGTILYHVHRRNADKTPERWRVNGVPKTWKTRPDEVRVPVKHGLHDYDYDYIEASDLDWFCLSEEEVIKEHAYHKLTR